MGPVRDALRPGEDCLHVLWSKVDQRAALHHIFDTLAVHNVAVQPSKRDALVAWEETRQSTEGALVVGDSFRTGNACSGNAWPESM